MMMTWTLVINTLGKYRTSSVHGNSRKPVSTALIWCADFHFKGELEMRWLKHLTQSNRDERLREIINKHGLEGYGMYWIILELIAEQLDEKRQTSLTYSMKEWS